MRVCVCFKAMFMAYGPKFNNELEIESFDNIELYNLMSGNFLGFLTFQLHLPVSHARRPAL